MIVITWRVLAKGALILSRGDQIRHSLSVWAPAGCDHDGLQRSSLIITIIFPEHVQMLHGVPNEGFGTAAVLGNIFRIDLAVGKPPPTLPNTSKPQYSSFLEFPILRLDPQILEFRPAES